MEALYSLILASGTKEALFAALWLALGETPGTFADVDFATLRATAARFGVALSESQVRKRVKELEKLDVLAVAPRRERGRFDLLVFQPALSKVATAPKPEPATPLFDAAFGKGVESFADRDRAVPGPRPAMDSVSAPVGRDALAQLRADAASGTAAVSEMETETETASEPVATSQTPPSKAERADALLARTRFADALRRAVNPSDYNAIHCQTRLCRGESIDGLSVGEVDLIDWRVGEFAVESRKIVGEYVDRLIAGEYRGRRDVCEAEMNAALLAFAKTRAAAIAPTFAEVRDQSRLAPPRRVESENVQPPEVATCAASPFAAEATENRVETPNRFAIERDRSRLAPLRRVESENVQTAEVATCAASPFAAEATENRVETPNRFAIERDRSRLAEPELPTVAAPLEEINIKNKTINKPANDFGAEAQASVDATLVADVRSLVDFESPKDAVSRPDVADGPSLVDFESPKDAVSRPDVADVRSLVDFASPKVAALRREIVDRVWEPTVHPDLIDRLTAAVVLRVGGATRSTVFALIREACDARSLFERSNGRSGKRTIWETAALRTKRLFENAGWRWSPTRFADEPRPSRSPVAPVEANDERERTGRTSSATTERSVDETRSVEELATTAAGFDASELDLPFADFSRLVARRRGIADACESRGVALEIRNALRELAKRELATV